MPTIEPTARDFLQGMSEPSFANKIKRDNLELGVEEFVAPGVVLECANAAVELLGLAVTMLEALADPERMLEEDLDALDGEALVVSLVDPVNGRETEGGLEVEGLLVGGVRVATGGVGEFVWLVAIFCVEELPLKFFQSPKRFNVSALRCTSGRKDYRARRRTG